MPVPAEMATLPWHLPEATARAGADGAIRPDQPANPSRLRPEFDCGDHLHPSDAGYTAMAASIDLSIFD